MADLSITNTFTTGTTIVASEVNTNNTDISGFINDRNNAVTDWDAVSSAGLITAKALFRSNDGTVGAPAWSFTSDTDNGTRRIGADNWAFVVAGADALEFDPIGAITTPLQPSFHAGYTSGEANVTGNATVFTVVFNTERYDQNSDFNTSTGIFTSPVTGRYLLTTTVLLKNLTAAATSYNIEIVTSNQTYAVAHAVGAAGNYGPEITVIADMDSADIAFVRVTVFGEAGDVVDLDTFAGQSWFCGSLIA